MRRIPSSRDLKRFILDENIYFSSKQICELLNINKYCLNRQLKQVLKISGCQSEHMRVLFFSPARRPYQHRYLNHYNLNTVVAIAYRINNPTCKLFLESYHRMLLGLHLRVVGPHYQVPLAIANYEFQAYTNRYTPYLMTDLLD